MIQSELHTFIFQADSSPKSCTISHAKEMSGPRTHIAGRQGERKG